MKSVYNLLIFLYGALIKVAAWVNPKARLFVSGRKNLLSKIQADLALERRPLIWMHCASLGEFEQGRPILEILRKKIPGHGLVLTFFSPSGYQVQKKYSGVDYVYYLPLDTPQNAKLFVKYLNPSLVIFVKYDFWYNHLAELSKNRVPTLLVDGIFRPSQPFFKWYGVLHRQMLRFFTFIFVQNEASKLLLQGRDINDVAVIGDTRFDRVLTVANSNQTIPKIESLAKRHKLLIAGSTWPQDEVLLQKVLGSLSEDWRLVVVPHDVDESRIRLVEQIFGATNTIRWSEWDDSLLNQKILIVDTIGILSKLYRHASFAWIGGGLHAKGVHNILEAAVYGVPCAFGPVHQKYQEAKDLIACGGAVSCSDEQSLYELLVAIQANEELANKLGLAAKEYVSAKAGATDEIINYLEAKYWFKIV